jgi:all-trans-retinol 13,14-reductase
MNKSCIIIGGGVGGLFTGAFLAKNGYRVTILEKNSIVGGGLQCFSRNGKIYETGMHVVGGFMPGGSLYKLCHYLGIYQKLNIQHIPCGCMDEIRIDKTSDVYKIASGKHGFVDSLAGYFPDEKEHLAEYVEALYRLTREVPMYYLSAEKYDINAHSEEFLMPADKLIAKYIKDSKLREVLAYLNPLYGGVKGHTPAYVHALLNVLYINGSSRFVAGSQQLADALIDVVVNGGGEVVANTEVTAINVVDKSVTGIVTGDGREYVADCYVSSMHPAQLVKLVPKGTFRKVFIKRLDEIPNTYSAFSVFIDLKLDRFKYIDHTCYFLDDYDAMWTQNRYDELSWPHGFMYMTPPDDNQGEYASRLLVHCALDYDVMSRWADTTVGRRGDSYLQWKGQQVEKIVAKLSKVFPGFRDMIAKVYSASPLTIRDYYNTKNGAIFGYRKDCENMIFSQLPVYTKVKNLYLTGQNINLHGICGVPLTAVSTAEAILGDHIIINAINNEAK